jgi:hypothetical protein
VAGREWRAMMIRVPSISERLKSQHRIISRLVATGVEPGSEAVTEGVNAPYVDPGDTVLTRRSYPREGSLTWFCDSR